MTPGGRATAPRILGGALKGRALEVPRGRTTRPLKVLVRRSLFDILGSWIADRPVLDLFAGSGSVGLEAASRGARPVVLVDQWREAVQALARSVESFGVGDRVQVVRMEAQAYLERTPLRFDLAFLGPPYALFDAPGRPLDAILARLPAHLLPDARAVLECPGEKQVPAVPGLALEEIRPYGGTTLAFFRAPPSAPAQG